MRAYDIITEDIRAAIEKSIADAESMTSGEIRVHIEDECSIDPLERAAFIFEKLKKANKQQIQIKNAFTQVGHEGLD